MNELKSAQRSTSYQATVWTAINLFFVSLIVSKVIIENPCDSIKRPKIKDKVEIKKLEKEELDQIIDAIQSGIGGVKAKKQQKEWKWRDMLIILLFLHTGMRISALDEINIEDIDFENCSIRVIEKGKKVTVKYFDSSLLLLFEKWLEKRMVLLGDKETNALLISNRRERMNVQSIRAIVDKYTSVLERRVNPHTFRSTYASLLYQETKDILFVKGCLGHSKIKSTMHYIKENPKAKIEAAKIMSDIIVE